MTRTARTIRCYTDNELIENLETELDKRASHHLGTVLRAKVGDELVLFNGDGNNYRATLVATGKKTVARIIHVEAADTESTIQSTLVQCISRGDRMDASVQKSTELGVSSLQPVYSRHSITALDDKRSQKKLEHWKQIAISASEQSGRCIVPTIHPPQTLAQYLRSPAENSSTSRLVLSPTATQGLDSVSADNAYCILVGPESGLDADEIASAVAAGFVEVLLGKRILRTETAGPAMLAIIQARFGDL